MLSITGVGQTTGSQREMRATRKSKCKAARVLILAQHWLKDMSKERAEGDKYVSEKTVLDVLGICCPSEASLIERILKPLAGIERVSVSIPTKTAIIVHNSRLISASQIAKALNEAGLDASIGGLGSESNIKTRWPSPYTIASGILLGIASFQFWFSPDLRWVALGAVAVGIPPMIRKSMAALGRFVMDINVLMVIAVCGTIGLGDYLEAGSIVFLFTLAEWLESRSSDKARAAISYVMKLAPQTAVIAETGLKIAVNDVEVDTLLCVKAGELVPIDGLVMAGGGSVDESSVTGEHVPVEKDVGSSVWAGTMNLTGYMTVRTTALAQDSAVARMAKLVEEAQNQRSPTQQFVEQFAKYYTPVVVIVAAGLAVCPWVIGVDDMHYWLYLALILLVVSCPCALVISTPVTTTCGLSQAAKMGLFIKGGSHLEVLGKLKAIAFDKTGTLTQGQFRVLDIQCLQQGCTDMQKLLYWICSLEDRSNHPMAAALVAYSRLHGVEPSAVVEDFEVIAGEGVRGLVDHHRIHIGNARLASRMGWISTQEIWNIQGATVGYVGVDDQLAGIFSVGDQIRPQAAEAVNDLKKLGLEIIMLSGDSTAATATMQRQIGEMEVYSELLPEDKVRIIGEMKEMGMMIAMVGDGINDAPALAAADIGIAMGVTGSAVAMETAHMALMSNDIRKIAEAVKLGRRCVVKIYQNVAFSFVIKLAFIILAFTGHAALWAAVLADMGTCFLVTFNSMLLLHTKSKTKFNHCDNPGINAPKQEEDQYDKQRNIDIQTSSCCRSTTSSPGGGCLKPRTSNRCCENSDPNDLYVPLLGDDTKYCCNFKSTTAGASQQICTSKFEKNSTNEQHFNASGSEQPLEIVVEVESTTQHSHKCEDETSID
eukprot:Gb_30489 [translate_table: standard]